jgi:hypothetical protein
MSEDYARGRDWATMLFWPNDQLIDGGPLQNLPNP